MSNVIASQRSFAPSESARQQPNRTVQIPNTDYLDLSYDSSRRALWIYLTDRAPAFVSLEMMEDLLSVDNVYSTALARSPDHAPPVNFKIMASKRPGIFSLGGDLARFRDCIDKNNRNELAHYAHASLDAIWTNTQGANVEDLTTVALVQGEAQGGGFEAALSAHLLVAEKGAMFGFPEALFGLFPGMGGHALLSARAGSDCARRLIGSTNRYSAEMLHEMGVIDILAEQGEGQQTLDAWMETASNETTLQYRTRFADLDRNQLLDSVDEWVDQALSLNRRQLRTMGYILEAQKRASEKPAKATVTHLRRTIDFGDLISEQMIPDAEFGKLSPLVITPKTVRRFNETEFFAFVKNSRPWVYENLSRHGAILMRGFSNNGAGSLSKLCAALRPDRQFNAARSIPTPAALYENVFEDDCWLSETAQALHNAYSDCTIFPSFKILACDANAPQPGGTVTLANTRSMYESLSDELILEFERRGITYRRLFPTIDSYKPDTGLESCRVHSWQNIFKTSDRDVVENKCRDNGLSYLWHSNGSVEIWNSAPACVSHTDTRDRVWFNQVHLFKSTSNNFIERKSLLSKLFSIVKSPASLDVNFSDGSAIPQSYLDEITAVHQRVTIEVPLEVGDYLLIDNVLNAQGRHALGKDQRLFMTAY